MNYDEIKSEELLKIYAKINDFIKFLDKEEKDNNWGEING